MSGVAVWAFAPLDVANGVNAKTARAADPVGDEEVGVPRHLDPTAFDVTLWNPATVEVDAAQAALAARAPRGLPFRLQLVGIMQDEGQFEAAIYDPDEDRLVVAKSGDRIAGHEITKLTASGVTFGEGRFVRELRIEEGRR